MHFSELQIRNHQLRFSIVVKARKELFLRATIGLARVENRMLRCPVSAGKRGLRGRTGYRHCGPNQGYTLRKTAQSTCQSCEREGTKAGVFLSHNYMKQNTLVYGRRSRTSSLSTALIIANYGVRERLYHYLPNAWKHRVCRPSGDAESR